MPDITIESHGSIVLLRPQTEAGQTWIDENCAAESWQWLGGALAVEPRMACAIYEGAQDDDLQVDFI